MNPILILTARELFSEFTMTDFYSFDGDKADYARSVYMRDDMEELCDFTQQLYLGMPSYHQWLEEKRRKRAARLAAKRPAPHHGEEASENRIPAKHGPGTLP
jgi:hypothetical protein